MAALRGICNDMSQGASSAGFFEDKYRHNPDPWAFESSEYELARYNVIVDALKYRRYERAFEPGCSIGVLTQRLAPLCEQLLSMDISATAVSLARQRFHDLPNVQIICGEFPSQMPHGSFDLIVLSEIGYYFDRFALQQSTRKLRRRLRSSGTLLAVHWLGESEDHVLSGDEVHEILDRSLDLILKQSDRYAGFRLDRWAAA
jgi:SAM-dependent methyltransferase